MGGFGISCRDPLRGLRVFDDDVGPSGVMETTPLHRGGASSSFKKERNDFISLRTASRVQPVQWIVESKALVRIWEHDYLSFLFILGAQSVGTVHSAGVLAVGGTHRPSSIAVGCGEAAAQPLKNMTRSMRPRDRILDCRRSRQ